MKSLFVSESSCKDTQILDFHPQSWLQVERGKLSKPSSFSFSSIESLIKIVEPPILPLFKPIDYVKILAQIHEELENCEPNEKSNLYLLQFHVFQGLNEKKLLKRSLNSALKHSTTVYEKIIYANWLRYEKRGEEFLTELLESCGRSCNDLDSLNVGSQIPIRPIESIKPGLDLIDSIQNRNRNPIVWFQIREEKIECERCKIANLSIPFDTMLNGPFTESNKEVIDLSENNISPAGMRIVSNYSLNNYLDEGLSIEILLEILIFANKFCCERLKEACDRKLANFNFSIQESINLLICAIEQNTRILPVFCLQTILRELPACLSEDQIVNFFCNLNKEQQSIMLGPATFPFYCFLTDVSLNTEPKSDNTVKFLEKLIECSFSDFQKQIAYHKLGCVRLLRKEYEEAVQAFNAGLDSGHVYSIAGLARIDYIKGDKASAYEKMTSVISSHQPLGWMFLERSLYTENKIDDLNKATKLDPTLIYPYMYRSINLLKNQDPKLALEEINRILGFKTSLECLELRFCIFLTLENYDCALCDVHAILTLNPEYLMVGGRVAASKIATLLGGYVEKWSTADCWMNLYEKWSNVDDIGSLSVIYRMLESDASKSVLYFRQSLLLLRLNCPESAMRSLELARSNSSTKQEQLVYEGWLLYDTGHFKESLKKAEESISLQRSFEAFFLKAYVLADSGTDARSSVTCIELLEEALKCPSDRLRKGQALNNLGGVYLDCSKLDLASDCYMSALKIRHTRAHQGLARIHFLKNKRKEAFDEMTLLIQKSRSNASAFEKRSEYGERDHSLRDLEKVTELDPVRVYPYRYRAAVLMDSHKEKEAIEELTRAIAFKADLYLLHLRAAFHEHIGDLQSALRDCRAALSLDPSHQEMLELQKRVYDHETIRGFETM